VRTAFATAMTVAAVLLWPHGAGAATVTLHPPSGNEETRDAEDGYIDVTDGGEHRNSLSVRLSRKAVLVVEHGRPPLKARGGCVRRSGHVVICRVRDPDNFVYLDSGSGRDVVRCRNGDISMEGGAGKDRLLAGSCSASMRGQSGNDLLIGGRFADAIYGGGGNDVLRGGGGPDVLYGDGLARSRGNDRISGGSGRDIAAWDESGRAIHADLRSGRVTSRGQRDRLTGVEDIAGSLGNDVLVGNAHANRLKGASGRDVLVGRGGNDLLDGGTESPGYFDNNDRRVDRFRCGAGRDTIRYPDRAALPVDCERMQGDFLQFWGETIPARPVPSGRHTVKVPTNCDLEFQTCRRRAVVRAGRRVLGRTSLVTVRGKFVRVRLGAAAKRRGVVTILVRGYDSSPGEGSEPYRFSWRVSCRGAGRRDVCRAGG
jgi:Ca2+-binding RTX toxin-like protein